ncbi:MAG: hypothetical protein LBV72_14805 [Tannerella sp.]|jgi:hypothetical protein|nr:hypothetical protein [Tannerella sp.]
MANVYILRFKDEPGTKYCYSSLGALYLAHGKEKLIVNKKTIATSLNDTGIYDKMSYIVEKHPLYTIVDVAKELDKAKKK